MATTTTTTVTTAASNNRGNNMNSNAHAGNGSTERVGGSNSDSKSESANSATPFLDELAKSERHAAGIFLIRGFVGSPEEQRSYFDTMNDDAQFPWNHNPKLFGEKLQQHAYLYQRKERERESFEGLRLLERICVDIETRFDGKISDVYCNRFQDPQHQIEWHSDKYGRHIFVLSLGAARRIEFRPKKQREIVHAVEPAAGDLYFMPLALNDTHKHRVCPAAAAVRDNDEHNDNNVTTRLSFVFFFQTPAYAKDYKITTWQKIRGTVEALLE